jgi:hypothetical protein
MCYRARGARLDLSAEPASHEISFFEHLADLWTIYHLRGISMDLFSAAVGSGLFGAWDRIIELYKIKRDGTFYEQKAFESVLDDREAAVAAEQQMASSAASDWRGLEIQLATISQTDRLNRLMAASPFRLSPADTRETAWKASGEGAAPVMLCAPLGIDKRVSEADSHFSELDILDHWSRHPCSGDVVSLGGLVDRPLKNQDLDVHIITETLPGIPAIILYGQLKPDRTLWLLICACNIMTKETRPELVKIALPEFPLPPPGAAPEAISAWKDNVRSQVTTVVALLAQWFHLVRYQRRPALERFSSLDGGQEIRKFIAARLIPAYEVLASYGSSGAALRIDQTELFVEAGLAAQAGVYALSILGTARDQAAEDTDYATLARLRAIFDGIGDTASAAEVADLAETRSRRAVERALGWVA